MNTNNDTQKRLDTLKRFGVASGLAAGALATSQAHALDVSAALSGSDTSANIDTAAVWILGIAVTIFAARKVIGFFSR
jgi:putative effector of murein hydrolase